MCNVTKLNGKYYFNGKELSAEVAEVLLANSHATDLMGEFQNLSEASVFYMLEMLSEVRDGKYQISSAGRKRLECVAKREPAVIALERIKIDCNQYADMFEIEEFGIKRKSLKINDKGFDKLVEFYAETKDKSAKFYLEKQMELEKEKIADLKNFGIAARVVNQKEISKCKNRIKQIEKIVGKNMKL